MKLWLEEWHRSQHNIHLQQYQVGDAIMKQATHRWSMRGQYVVLTLLLAVGLCLLSGPLMAQAADVTPLMSKDLTDIPGKEMSMITVQKAPGGADPIHRHNAHAFVYVLEGSIVMQVEGGKEVTLTPGQTFYEGPSDVHVVGRNASSTAPAKFLVVLVKDKGAPVVVPVK
ncbi:MAG TPA: cupin domain-containing protein [Nitrospiraceae bacterium]|nr:cupin domain-containing protein [Nitrospiraceae bacterium]